MQRTSAWTVSMTKHEYKKCNGETIKGKIKHIWFDTIFAIDVTLCGNGLSIIVVNQGRRRVFTEIGVFVGFSENTLK